MRAAEEATDNTAITQPAKRAGISDQIVEIIGQMIAEINWFIVNRNNGNEQQRAAIYT
jgi:hypothetical protein